LGHLVETRPGQGTFVVQKIHPFVMTLTGNPRTGAGDEGASYLPEVNEQNRKPTTSPLQVEIQEASEDIARALGIPEGAEVISRHERRFIDGTPWSMRTSYYPMEFADRAPSASGAPGTSRKEPRSTRERASTSGQVGYRNWITVRAPNPTEADFFKLPLDGRVPVFEIFRTAFDGNRQPMRVTVTVFPTDRNQFIIDVGQVPVSNPMYRQIAEDLREQIVSGGLLTRQQDTARREVVQVLLALTITSTVAGVISALAAVWAVLPKRRTQPQTVVIIVKRQPFREFSRRALTPLDADPGPAKPN
jgi:GntR family transcriptional regulator